MSGQIRFLQYMMASLTLFRAMEFSIRFDTVKSGWSIINIEESQVIISKESCISFSEDQVCPSKQCRP